MKIENALSYLQQEFLILNNNRRIDSGNKTFIIYSICRNKLIEQADTQTGELSYNEFKNIMDIFLCCCYQFNNYFYEIKDELDFFSFTVSEEYKAKLKQITPPINKYLRDNKENNT